MTRAARLLALVLPLVSASSAPPRAHFERIATLSWAIASQPEQPWSPDGNRLALYDGARLAVFDVRRPDAAPRVLLEPPGNTSYSIAWSPDSRWIACGSSSQAFRPDSQSIRFSETLWVIPADGGSPIVLEPNSEARPFLWASDGFLYVREHDRVRRIALPPQVRVAPGGPVIERPPPMRYRDVLGREWERNMEGAIRLPRNAGGKPGAPYPDHARFVMERKHRYVVIDTAGSVVSGLGGPVQWDSAGTDPGVYFANSVTPDGRFLAGTLADNDPDAIGEGEEGGTRWRAFLVSLDGWTRIPLENAPRSSKMHCAPCGERVALEVDRSDSMRVEVGILRIER